MSTKAALIEVICANAGITAKDAEKVIRVYRSLRVIKSNAHDGMWVVHGGFLDAEVIRRALAQA